MLYSFYNLYLFYTDFWWLYVLICCAVWTNSATASNIKIYLRVPWCLSRQHSARWRWQWGSPACWCTCATNPDAWDLTRTVWRSVGSVSPSCTPPTCPICFQPAGCRRAAWRMAGPSARRARCRRPARAALRGSRTCPRPGRPGSHPVFPACPATPTWPLVTARSVWGRTWCTSGQWDARTRVWRAFLPQHSRYSGLIGLFRFTCCRTVCSRCCSRTCFDWGRECWCSDKPAMIPTWYHDLESSLQSYIPRFVCWGTRLGVLITMWPKGVGHHPRCRFCSLARRSTLLTTVCSLFLGSSLCLITILVIYID